MLKYNAGKFESRLSPIRLAARSRHGVLPDSHHSDYYVRELRSENYVRKINSAFETDREVKYGTLYAR